MEGLSSPKEIIRLSKSCIGVEEKNAVMGVLEREFLGMGKETHMFETALTDYFGRPAVCVANGTSGLQLALQACGIGAGDEVLVQSCTYIASFQAISATGAKPIACDIDMSTLTLDWMDAERRLTNKTKAIMPVHYGGCAGRLDEIYKFAKKYGLRVIEDAAHAFGTIYKDRRIGSFGDVVCFSFDGIKNITSGEGGCVVSNDLKVVERIKDLRLLGVAKDTDSRFSGRRTWEFNVKTQGWRYHMSNIMAAIGNEQLKKFPKFAALRQSLALRYDEIFSNNNSVICRSVNYTEVVPHIYSLRIVGLKSRSALQKKLLKFGIETGFHYQPNHTHDLYFDEKILPLPATDVVSREILTLPLHADLTEVDVDFVGEVLKRVI